MCSGESSRQSFGGTIAILKSACSDGAAQEMSLLLAEDCQTGHTTATLSGTGSSNGDRQVVIHRDGDLRANLALDDSTILLRFNIPTRSTPGRAFPLSAKLDLGVGGNGVIGRRVSLLHGHLVAAEGIIGWN